MRAGCGRRRESGTRHALHMLILTDRLVRCRRRLLLASPSVPAQVRHAVGRACPTARRSASHGSSRSSPSAIAEHRLPGAVVARRRARTDPLQEGIRQPRHRARARADDGRHHLRRRLADESRGDDDGGDAAPRTGPARARRSRWRPHPGVRALWQGSDHDSPPADAHLRAAGRPRSGRSSRARPKAIRRAVEEVPVAAPNAAGHLLRHQLLPARPHRRAHQRRSARRFARDAHLRSARHARHDVPAARRAASEDRADRILRAARVALRRPPRRCCAASCTTRRRVAWAASPGMRGCSARPTTCASSAGCC